jgi:hypothetical protein
MRDVRNAMTRLQHLRDVEDDVDANMSRCQFGLVAIATCAIFACDHMATSTSMTRKDNVDRLEAIAE